MNVVMKNKIDFTIREGEEFIPLVQLLKVTQVVNSGGEAQVLVAEGQVFLNGVVDYRKRAKIRPGDVVTTMDIEILVH
jgi:ribosome-associated protein